MHFEDSRQTAVTIVSLFLAACVVAFLLFLLPSCGTFSLISYPKHSNEMLAVKTPTVAPHCVALNRDVIALTASSIGFSVLSSSAGVSAFFTSSTPRYAVIGTGLVLTLGSGITTSLSTSFASNFTQECTTPAVSP